MTYYSAVAPLCLESFFTSPHPFSISELFVYFLHLKPINFRCHENGFKLVCIFNFSFIYLGRLNPEKSCNIFPLLFGIKLEHFVY